jgi:sugar porter (SP) family MFS transporter
LFSQTGAATERKVNIWLPVSVAALGGLLFGFDTAVVNGALVFLRRHFAMSDAATEVAASSLLAGCAIGAALAGFLSDRLGRRRLLLAAAALFTLSSFGSAVPATLGEFVAARVAGGLAIGIASMLSPLYIAEISPARIRGRLVATNQLTIVIGILLSYCVNYWLAPNWRWMFGSAAIPSVLFLLALLKVPESPRWLAEQGRAAEALAVLASLAGRAEAERELKTIEIALAGEAGSVWEPALRRPLALAIALAVFQQVTGINTILYYGSLLFVERVPGQTDSAALLASVGIGVMNLVCTVVAMGLVDRSGRRPLLLLATSGMGVSLCALAAAIGFGASGGVILGVILVYVACFSTGLGPGVWIVMSEIFPTRVRGRAMSIATVSLWLACLLITATFLTLMNTLTPAGAFLVYAAMCAAAFVLVFRWIPETKGRTLEEIEAGWSRAAVGNRLAG